MNRRSFLALPGVATIGRLFSGRSVREHRFEYDHVIGTSLDAVIWSADDREAQRAMDAALREIDRLSAVLDTRNPESEINRPYSLSRPSSELAEVLALYSRWEKLTGGVVSIRPGGANSPLNVDALGKAFIIDRAVRAAREASRSIEGVLLNIGGDIVVSGRECEIAVADPEAPFDNGEPLTRVLLKNAAIATSGSYARGAHLLDPRTGRPARALSGATVIAPDVVTANALALSMCVNEGEGALRLVESTPGAAALWSKPGGFVQRTQVFAKLERVPQSRKVVLADWPTGYQVTLSLVLKPGGPEFVGRGGRGGRGRGGPERQYVAVWITDEAGKMVRVLAFWANKPRYFNELSIFWTAMARDENRLSSVARATRPAGTYEFVWDGTDDQRRPVPTGTYKINVETNQEHGAYAKKSGLIDCGTSPSELTLSATANFEAVSIHYSPKQNLA